MSPKQKIAPNCSFFAIRDRREFPRSQIKTRKRSKMAILRLFSASRERRGVPNRKKVTKSSLFLFLQLADRHDGANPTKNESPTHQNQGMHLQSDKKTARRRFRSQIYGWASRIRTYITGTKNQGPAIGRWPSVCHKAFCDYNVSGMVKPNKQPIRQNATTQYGHHHATCRERILSRP